MTKIESFEIENPPNYPQRQLSQFYDDEDIEDEDSNTEYYNKNDINAPTMKKSKELQKKLTFLRFKGDNEFYGVVNLLASAIGSGCVTFPSLLQTAGIVTSLIIFIIVSISIYFSLDLLRNFIISTNLFSLSEITQKVLGNNWLKMYAFMAVIFYLSMEINYINLIVEYGAKGILSIEKKYQKIIFYVASCIIEIVLCLFTSKISHLHILSLITAFCFVFIVVSLVIYTFMHLNDKGIKDKFSSDKYFMPIPDSKIKYIMSIFSCFIEYVYSYSCHSSFPTILGNLKTKEEKTKNVLKFFYASIFIMYSIISIFGYISQINADEGHKTLILFADESLQGLFNYVLQITIIVFFTCLIPIRFIVIRDNYIALLKFDINYKIDLIFISINIILANVISYFCSTDANIIFSLNEMFGGVFGVAICFVLPVVTYISINKKSEKKSIFGYIMAIFYLIIGLFTAGYSFCEKILKIV